MAASSTLRGSTLRGKTRILAAPGDSLSPAVLQRSTNRLLQAGAGAQAQLTATPTLIPFSLVQLGSGAGNAPLTWPTAAAVGSLLVRATYNATATPPVARTAWTGITTQAGTALSGSLHYQVVTALSKYQSYHKVDHAQGPASGVATDGSTIVISIGNAAANNKLIRSTDSGRTWTNGTFNDTTTWRPLAYGNGIFLAMNFNSATAQSSVNGTTWTNRALGVAASGWWGIAFGGGRFVITSNGTTPTLTTTDGISYTAGVFPGGFGIGALYVAYGGGVFVGIPEYNVEGAWTTDGVNWTATTLPNQAQNWTGIAYGNGKFVAATQNGTFTNSTNGVSWTAMTAALGLTASGIGGISFGDGLFLFTTSTGFATSPDGVTWTEYAEAAPAYVGGAWRVSAYCTDRFVVGGYAGGVMTSNWLSEADVTYLSYMIYDNFNSAGPIGAVAASGGSGLTATVPALTLLQTPKRPFATSFLGYSSTDIVFPNPSTGTAPLAYQQAQANGAAGSTAVYDTAGSVA